METKTCRCCKETKPASEFHKHKRTKDGLNTSCAVCTRKRAKAWGEKNKKRRYEIQNRWKIKNPERWAAIQHKCHRTLKTRYKQILKSAKAKNYDASKTLTFSEYEQLVKNPCSYCGRPLDEAGKGLDRLDSSRGYELNNVVTCCGVCNAIKNVHSLEFLLEHLPKFIEGAKKLLKAPSLAKTLSAFEKDLKFGNCAEEYLANTNPEKFELLDGRKGDLKLKSSGKIVEVKTERRSDEDTANIFVEKVSNKTKGTKGGPWAALENGCEYIAYLFWPTKKAFVYPVKALVEFLESKKYKPFEVFVGGSKAIGLIVPREHIAHLEIGWGDLK